MDAAASISIESRRRARPSKRPLLKAIPGSWPTAIVFMLSLSALGLFFYPALLVTAFIMARSWRRSRYDFLLQLMLVVGGYGFTNSEVTFVNLGQLGFLLGVIFAFLLRKDALLKRLVAASAAYFAVMWALAFYDDESVRNQWSTINVFAEIIFFTVPLAVFAGRQFSYDRFIRSVFPYAMVACVFYILDAFVLSGWVLVPRLQAWGATTAFYDLAWAPLTGWVVRKYPPGLYILVLLLLPLARQYRLKAWQWVVIVLAVMSTQTFTFISGLVLAFIIAQGGVLRAIKYGALAVVALTVLYFVDDSMSSEGEYGAYESPMRISSTINQFVELGDVVDYEDMADFGSGRVAQAIPALDLLYRLGYEWHGIGFVAEGHSDNPRFFIENEFASDVTNNETFIGQIEISALRVLFYIGYIGLAVHILYFLYLYLAVRRLRHSDYLLCVMCVFVWLGLGGFEGLITQQSLTLVAMALAVPLLCHRNSLNTNRNR